MGNYWDGRGGKNPSNDWDMFEDKYGVKVGKGKKEPYTTSTLEYSGKCALKHPPLKLPGTDFVIYGGSCWSPVVTDADVYIGFDSGMTVSPRSYPWNEGHEVLFKISDMCAPANPKEFKKLVAWTLEQLGDGKKVHCGCIGGHGRTGTFLAACVSACGAKDAIQYVRKNYCHKAVESGSQINFLVKHFGVNKADPGKTYAPSSGKGSKGNVVSLGGGFSGSPSDFAPVADNGSIWNEPRTLLRK